LFPGQLDLPAGRQVKLSWKQGIAWVNCLHLTSDAE